MELLRIAANDDDVTGTKPFTKVYGIYLTAGADAASVSLFDALTQTGTAKVVLKAAAATSDKFMFEKGFPLKTGASITLTGTSPVAYLLVD